MACNKCNLICPIDTDEYLENKKCPKGSKEVHHPYDERYNGD